MLYSTAAQTIQRMLQHIMRSQYFTLMQGAYFSANVDFRQSKPSKSITVNTDESLNLKIQFIWMNLATSWSHVGTLRRHSTQKRHDMNQNKKALRLAYCLQRNTYQSAYYPCAVITNGQITFGHPEYQYSLVIMFA